MEEIKQEEVEPVNTSASQGAQSPTAQEEKKEISVLTPEQLKMQQVSERPIKIRITFNNQEWIDARTFKYHDASITRMAYAHNFSLNMDQSLSVEEREA